MKYLHISMMIIALLGAAFLTACQEGPASEAPLEGVTWVLESYTGEMGATEALETPEVTLNFNSEEGQLGGNAGCNHYGGKYELHGNKLTLRDVTATLMGCLNEAVMDQEQAYLKAFSKAEEWKIEGGTLVLTGGNFQIRYREKTDTTTTTTTPTRSDDLAGTRWKLVSYTGEMGTRQALEKAEVTLIFDEDGGQLGGVAGCNQYGAAYTIGRSGFEVTDIFRTEMYCTGEGVMGQEDNYLAALQAAEMITADGDTLTISGGGWKLVFEKTYPES